MQLAYAATERNNVGQVPWCRLHGKQVGSLRGDVSFNLSIQSYADVAPADFGFAALGARTCQVIMARKHV